MKLTTYSLRSLPEHTVSQGPRLLPFLSHPKILTRIASYAEIIANNAFDGNKTFAIDNGLKDAGCAHH